MKDKRPLFKKFEQLVKKFEPNSRLLRARVLTGGASAQVAALEIQRPNVEMQMWVVRQHGAIDLKQNPQIAADEFRLLKRLKSSGLAVPTPYYVDPSGEVLGTPCIVVEYIEGEPEFAPSHFLDSLIVQLATYLSRIHRVDCVRGDFAFLPSQLERAAHKLRERPAILDHSLDEGRIRDTLDALSPLKQHNPVALLHGDYWPGNVLWRHEQLVAVIDWEDAALGDPLADFSNSRLEVLWAFGIEAMHRFTHHYQSLVTLDFTNLPYWDLYAALRPALKIGEWAGDATAEKRMRERHRWFITQAFQQLYAG